MKGFEKGYSRFYCERELETEQRDCNILTPTLMAISVVSFLFSWCLTGGLGAQLSAVLSTASCYQRVWPPNSLGVPRPLLPGGGFLYHNLSPTRWLPVFTEFNRPLILWNGMFDCHQVEIIVMQFTGRSLPVHQSLSTMGFYLVPFCQPSPPSLFLLITAIRMCHFLPVHHFGMACLAGLKVNIQQKLYLWSKLTNV